MSQTDLNSDLNFTDLLLIGFPKAGTTSLASWLELSGHCAVTKPKETFCLCPEFAFIRDQVGVDSLAEAFGGESGELSDIIRIEATSLNVYSTDLLSHLRNTSIKVIAVTRDHAEAVGSWHQQILLAGIAQDSTLKSIWDESVAQPQDTETRDFRLNYTKMFSQAEWLEKWTAELTQARVLILRQSEFSDSARLALKVGSFLDIEINKMLDVPSSNTRYTGNLRVASLFRTKKIRKLLNILERQGLPIQGIKSVTRRVLSAMSSTNKTGGKSLLDSKLKEEITTYFEKDKERLDELIAKNSSHHDLI